MSSEDAVPHIAALIKIAGDKRKAVNLIWAFERKAKGQTREELKTLRNQKRELAFDLVLYGCSRQEVAAYLGYGRHAIGEWINRETRHLFYKSEREAETLGIVTEHMKKCQEWEKEWEEAERKRIEEEKEWKKSHPSRFQLWREQRRKLNHV